MSEKFHNFGSVQIINLPFERTQFTRLSDRAVVTHEFRRHRIIKRDYFGRVVSDEVDGPHCILEIVQMPRNFSGLWSKLKEFCDRFKEKTLQS